VLESTILDYLERPLRTCNHTNLNEDRFIMSMAKVCPREDCSFWQYELYADICKGSLARKCQMTVECFSSTTCVRRVDVVAA